MRRFGRLQHTSFFNPDNTREGNSRSIQPPPKTREPIWGASKTTQRRKRPRQKTQRHSSERLRVKPTVVWGHDATESIPLRGRKEEGSGEIWDLPDLYRSLVLLFGIKIIIRMFQDVFFECYSCLMFLLPASLPKLPSHRLTRDVGVAELVSRAWKNSLRAFGALGDGLGWFCL